MKVMSEPGGTEFGSMDVLVTLLSAPNVKAVCVKPASAGCQVSCRRIRESGQATQSPTTLLQVAVHKVIDGPTIHHSLLVSW